MGLAMAIDDLQSQEKTFCSSATEHKKFPVAARQRYPI